MSRRAPKQDRDVGAMGEQTFKKWCVDEGLTVNGSNPDRMGWDFIVEFQPEVDTDVPLDRQHVSKRLLVQAKSSDRPSGSVQAKLSALKRLVDNNDPSFIAHIEYAGGVHPVRARLLHIGKDEITAVLKAVRELQAKGRTDLHNRKISLSLTAAVELKPDGTGILQELYDAVPSDLAAYTAKKDDLRRSVGHGKGSIRASFSMSRPTGEEELVDLLIGRTKELRVDRLTIRRSRFQIELREDVDEITDVVLSVEAQGREVLLRVADEDGHTRAEVPARAYQPGIPDLPDHAMRTRIANEFVECVILPGGVGHLKVNIPSGERFDVHDLERMLRFGVHLGRSDSSFQIVLDGENVIETSRPENAGYLLTWATTHLFCKMISRALFESGLNSTMLLSLDDVERFIDQNEFMFVASRSADITFELGIGEGVPEDMPDHGLMFLPIMIRLDDVIYQAIAKAGVRAKRIGSDSIGFVTDKPHIFDERIVPYSPAAAEAWNKRATFWARQEEQRGIWIVTPRASENGRLIL